LAERKRGKGRGEGGWNLSESGGKERRERGKKSLL